MTEDVRCPLCGSKATLRTAKKGPDTGKQFHVCNRYPECKGRVEYTHDEQQEEDLEKEYTDKDKPKNRTGERVFIISAVFILITVIMVCLVKFDVINISLGRTSSSNTHQSASSPSVTDVEFIYLNRGSQGDDGKWLCTIHTGHISGKIQNIGTVYMNGVTVTVDYYNRYSGAYLSSDSQTLYSLPPNGIGEFSFEETCSLKVNNVYISNIW